MKKSVFFSLLGFTALWANPSLCQTSASLTSGADFLLVVPGARPAALGQAFTALGDDINALNFNPAGLAQIQVPEMGYDRYQFVSDISFDFLGAAIPLNQNGVLGLGFINAGTAPFNSTPDPNTPQVSAFDMAFLLGYGRAVGSFQLGGTVKFVLRQVGDVQGTGVLADLGMRYQVQPRLLLAASLQNLGDIEILNQDSGTPTLGRLGLAWRCLSSCPHSLDLAMDGDYEANSQSIRLGWGAEYWYQGLFALRAGYVGNSEEEGPAFGAGLRVSGFQLDYAYEPYNILGSTHRLSLLARLGTGGDAETPAPSNFQANPSNDGLLLTWDAPAFVDIKGYNLYVKHPGTDGFAPLTAHPITDTSVDLKNMKLGQDYEFAVSTVSSTGKESPLNRLTTVPQEPVLSAPTGFKAEYSDQGVELTWDKVDSKWVSGFNLYMVDWEGNPVRKMSDTPITDNQVTLGKLRRDKLYWFILTALSPDGQEGPPTPLLRVHYLGPARK